MRRPDNIKLVQHYNSVSIDDSVEMIESAWSKAANLIQINSANIAGVTRAEQWRRIVISSTFVPAVA